MSMPIGSSAQRRGPLPRPLPSRLPTGANPTLTPVRNKISPIMVYTKPSTIRTNWRGWKLRVSAWNSTNTPTMGSVLCSTSAV